MRIGLLIVFFGCLVVGSSTVCFGQRNYDPADQRPDLLPHPLYNNWVPYRSIYHRPRFVGGYLAYKMEPTSQEAMSWRDNYCAGVYPTKCPTAIPKYFYPKPWEALDVGPRKNFPKGTGKVASSKTLDD